MLFIVLFETVANTIQYVQITRRNKHDSDSLLEFAAWVNEEHCLEMAMLADSGDESSQLILFHDNEVYDLTSRVAQLDKFAQKSDLLFLQRGAMRCGYTELMLQTLRNPTTFLQKNGQWESAGGLNSVTRAMLDCRNALHEYIYMHIYINVISKQAYV